MRKTLRTYKTQKGGGIDDFKNLLRDDKSLKRLGTDKPVATPDTGLIKRMYDLWNGLTANEKNEIMYTYVPSIKGFHLGVEVSPPKTPNKINPIIFYSQEHLDLLAMAADMTKQQFLDMIKIVQTKDKYNMDLLNIAFNNDYDGPLNTEQGKKVKDKYMSYFS